MPGEVIRVIGPSTPVIGKIHDVYRRILYLKSEQEQALLDAKVQLELYAEQSGVQEACRLYFDLNPMKGY